MKSNTLYRKRSSVQQLTALMLESGGTPGMRPGGAAALGMCAVGCVGGTQSSFRAAVLQPETTRMAPPLKLYLGGGAELR